MNTVFAPLEKEVTVSSFYFTKSLRSFPRQIELDGERVTFAESGLRLLLQRGQQLAQLFDMSSAADGATYRLRLENNHWTLVGVKGATV